MWARLIQGSKEGQVRCGQADAEGSSQVERHKLVSWASGPWGVC